jgi:hypothetical protein
MGWSLHKMNIRIVLLNRVIKKRSVQQHQGFGAYQKGTLVFIWNNILYGFKQFGTKLPMHRRSMVKTFYNRDIVLEWLLRTPR